jgi:hypothetical protein
MFKRRVIFCLSIFMAHYPYGSSLKELRIHIYHTGYVTWVILDSRQHNSDVNRSLTFQDFIQSGFILQYFFLYLSFTIFLPAFFHRLSVCMCNIFLNELLMTNKESFSASCACSKLLLTINFFLPAVTL